MPRFKSAGSAQRSLSSHTTVYHSFNLQRDLIFRRTLLDFPAGAMEEWHSVVAA